MNENNSNRDSENSLPPGNGSINPENGTNPTPLPNTPPTLPLEDSSILETGSADTGELLGSSADDDLPGGGDGPDLMTCIFFGTTVALAVIVAVLSVLLFRSKKKKNPLSSVTDSPAQSSGEFAIGKLHEQGDRESQQDCFAVSPAELLPTHGLLAVVADGMGGLADGDKVSQTAVAAMLDGFLASGSDPDALLLALTERANHQVNRLLGPANIGKSGSTMVAGLIRNGRFHYLSIGDSRICLFRDGQLIQLNREHIYRHELSIQALSGMGSLQGAAAHPKAAGLTSYLGMGQLKYVDIPAQSVEIRTGDKFILMSDGVYNALSESEISFALNETAETAAQKIGEMIAAKAYRNQDNYTAVILAP